MEKDKMVGLLDREGAAARAPRERDVLVIGLGNTLLQDEGLGVAALRRLQDRYPEATGVKWLDGGTLGLDLLPYLEHTTHLLLLDALDVDQPAGTVARLRGSQIPAYYALKLSMHQAGVQELLAAARFMDTLPEQVTVLGVQPYLVGWGTELSSVVSASLAELVVLAGQELRSWGVTL